MSLDIPTVRRIAALARIRLEEGELVQAQAELNGILGWIEQLQEVDVSGVQPMTAVIPNHLRLREDKVTDGGIVALVRVAVSSQEPKGRWSTPSYLIKFVVRCYPWHSVYSIRLLEPEEKETLEDWPPEKTE